MTAGTPHPDAEIARRDALLGDERGAIVLMGVFMCVFLVGCLWYLIGIGDAALYRERLDAGADAAAFCAAVYHARGMNMIAMLNLIIAASMAVVIYAKGLDFVVAVAYNAALYLCAAGGASAKGDPACETARDAGRKLALLKTMIDKASEADDNLLGSLSEAQREIAVVTPWVASTRSTDAALLYRPIVELGAAVSPSMVPTNDRLGLPVIDEPYEATCGRGGLVAPEVIDMMVPEAYRPYIHHGAPADIASRLPTNYCGSSTAVIQKSDLDLFNEKDVCEEKREKWAEQVQSQLAGQQKPFDMAECIKEEHVTDAQVAKAIVKHDIPKVSPEASLQKGKIRAKKSGKMMSSGAVNGNDYFQVYAIVLADKQRFHHADSGVRFAAGGRADAVSQVKFQELGIAQAEFYYDQTPDAVAQDRCWTPPCGLTWPEYRDNALWNMRWRARLRLYRVPKDIDVNVIHHGLPTEAPVGVDGNYIPRQLGAVNSDLKRQIALGILKQRDLLESILK